jgi:multicomponent K+:H+ antiporter subunit E
MLRKIFPHPHLSILLIVVWLMLVNQLTKESLVFAVILSIFIPMLTATFWPDRPRLRNPRAIIGYVCIVIYDILVANITVAKIVLFMKNEDIQPAWIDVPLDVTSPEAITMLAGTITMTPGTITADLSADGHSLLVHCLHAPDPIAVRDDIKARYEARLKEIFE